MVEADKGAARFLETFGGIMIAAGFEWMIFVEHPSAVVVTGFIGGGIGIFFSGAYWESVKQHIPDFIIESIEAVASDVRYWMALVFVGWLSMLYLSAVQKIRIGDTVNAIYSETKQLRKDMDHYAMPRHLTDSQKSQIIAYLTDPSRPPQTIKLVVLNDSEAIDFGNDLSDALQAAHWTIQPTQVGLADFIAQNPGSQPEGLFYREEYVCVPGAGPDAKAEQFFGEAMARARVPLRGGSGGCSNNPKDTGMRIMVGLRPRTWHPEMKEVPADE